MVEAVIVDPAVLFRRSREPVEEALIGKICFLRASVVPVPRLLADKQATPSNCQVPPASPNGGA